MGIFTVMCIASGLIFGLGGFVLAISAHIRVDQIGSAISDFADATMKEIRNRNGAER